MAYLGARSKRELRLILTDREIKIALDRKQVIIAPLPGPEAFSSTALDLTLDPIARLFKNSVHGGIAIDPGAPEYNFREATELLTDQVNLEPTFALRPHKLLLAWTKESLNLPTISRLAARIEGKSSMARIGIGVHITAPTIHAGFSGQLQLEIINHGPTDIVLRPGMKICQLIFETTLGTPDKGYSGQFLQQQSG
jgi:dCTP deaminase